MSDIYLQITETPTVVTLSAPVVSGALSSTVTVANTVTVALDSNSLSALENVTVTVGAAITGTVTVSNFPATQPVSIASVTVGSLPNSLSIVNSSSVTKSDVQYTAIAGSINTSDGSSTYTMRPIAVNSSGQIYIDASVNSQSVFSYDGQSHIRIRPTNDSTVTIGSLPALVAGTAQIGSVTASISNSITIGSLPLIAGTVTANVSGTIIDPREDYGVATEKLAVQIYGTSGNPIGGLSGEALPISGTVTVGNSVTIGSLPSISGTVTANTFALQGTAVTTSNFTSTTASTVLAGYNATREVLTIFNEGAGNLHICAGATCTTIAYQVRLSAGDYYEVPNHQTTITHSAVFATAGTARVTEVS